jgi:hypothetical protein
VTPQPNGNLTYVVDIWCEDEHGLKLTEGDGSVEVAA